MLEHSVPVREICEEYQEKYKSIKEHKVYKSVASTNSLREYKTTKKIATGHVIVTETYPKKKK